MIKDHARDVSHALRNAFMSHEGLSSSSCDANHVERTTNDAMRAGLVGLVLSIIWNALPNPGREEATEQGSRRHVYVAGETRFVVMVGGGSIISSIHFIESLIKGAGLAPHATGKVSNVSIDHVERVHGKVDPPIAHIVRHQKGLTRKANEGHPQENGEPTPATTFLQPTVIPTPSFPQHNQQMTGQIFAIQQYYIPQNMMSTAPSPGPLPPQYNVNHILNAGFYRYPVIDPQLTNVRAPELRNASLNDDAVPQENRPTS
ncbi:hypothetical protein AX16_004690 [Volvariella volvacea WC 439]|nr:hypothetical protein AX16_004690 [Volvariella volvacea WC 439]